jgi:hypothetical protein
MQKKELIIHYEITDTFSGEANYSWVKRGSIVANSSVSDLAIVRRVKKAIGWNGLKCHTENHGDMIALYPRNMAMVCFITYREDATE